MAAWCAFDRSSLVMQSKRNYEERSISHKVEQYLRRADVGDAGRWSLQRGMEEDLIVYGSFPSFSNI